MREYGSYLELAGDYRGALTLFQRERKPNEVLSRVTREKPVLDLQGKYEADKRQRAFVPAAPPERIDDIVLRIMHTLTTEPVDHVGQAIRVTASIGYAPMPLPPDDLLLGWDGAISLVDKALYMAKANGRNRAYGISGMHSHATEGPGDFDGDLEAAWRDGIVYLRVMVGAQAVVAMPTSHSAH